MPKKSIPILQKKVKWRDVNMVSGTYVGEVETVYAPAWRTFYLYLIGGIAFAVLFFAVVNLQVVRGHELSQRSWDNRLEEREIQASRGVIYDRNGQKLAVNEPSFNLYVNPRDLTDEEVPSVLTRLEELIALPADDTQVKFYDSLAAEPLTQRILLVEDIDRDKVLLIKSNLDSLKGVWVDSTSKRSYVGGDAFAHLLGYTGEASAETVESDDSIDMGDIVGKDGLEYFYDTRFRGANGIEIVEVDAMQNVIAEYVNSGEAPVSGDSLYLTIDADAQRTMSDIMKAGVERYGATGGAAVLENVKTGEILAAVSVPTYDNNLFVGGISSEDYVMLATDPNLPLYNRIVSEQQPPGSMFKTIVASAALQEGAITPATVFVSNGIMYLSGDYPFQEYHQYAYGALDLNGGIAKSSNIYFCNTMLALGIDRFVPYAEFFGIGSLSGIDLPGEMPGRVPSPENKLTLAETSPWLDPIWYPEGDACNSAIGQGITLVTPIQVANWAATIANGGNVMKPRLAYKWVKGLPELSVSDLDSGIVSDGGQVEMVDSETLRSGMVSDENLALVRKGMRASTYGEMSVIVPLRDALSPVAAKTGTAEFGVKTEEGFYTATHAWVMGFFPYDDPQYSFVFFMEGGGESNNSAQLAREFIDWFAQNKMTEN